MKQKTLYSGAVTQTVMRVAFLNLLSYHIVPRYGSQFTYSPAGEPPGFAIHLERQMRILNATCHPYMG